MVIRMKKLISLLLMLSMVFAGTVAMGVNTSNAGEGMNMPVTLTAHTTTPAGEVTVTVDDDSVSSNGVVAKIQNRSRIRGRNGSLYMISNQGEEKEIKSVANVTREDVEEFLTQAAALPIIPEYQEFSLEDANIALMELKQRKIRGAKVLRIRH